MAQRQPLGRVAHMLRGIFSAKGVLPFEFEPHYSLGGLLLQRLEALERRQNKKSGMQQALVCLEFLLQH